MEIKFKNAYSERRRKKEFDIKPDLTEMTDQSQVTSASIVEMAKKFGIDAIIAKAEQTTVDATLQDKLYGHDYTKLFTSSEERLKVKNKLTNLFENIPARIRKEKFNDSIANFIDAYVTNDENKLSALNQIGIVSDTQLNSVKEYNKQKAEMQKENETRAKFVKLLENEGNKLYETYKTTGSIINNNSENNASGNTNV